ncbi:MAG: hypothetical protein CMC88_05995 [Flavobacteriaceae bacterium]|nr:hypothetical protein [Flavobacteriaceae bacterium]
MNKTKYQKFIDDFDPNSEENIEQLESLIKEYPFFLQPKLYYLKILKDKKSKKYDSELKKIAVSIYDRSWLFDWINLPWETKKHNNKSIEKDISIKMNFIDWINYIEKNKVDNNVESVDKKFNLIETFLNNPSKIEKEDIKRNQKDISFETLTSENELMTETLAKIYLKQKKYNKAKDAFKILSLKYPEKNAFFANQIKKIKKLENKK